MALSPEEVTKSKEYEFSVFKRRVLYCRYIPIVCWNNLCGESNHITNGLNSQVNVVVSTSSKHT